MVTHSFMIRCVALLLRLSFCVGGKERERLREGGELCCFFRLAFQKSHVVCLAFWSRRRVNIASSRTTRAKASYTTTTNASDSSSEGKQFFLPLFFQSCNKLFSPALNDEKRHPLSFSSSIPQPLLDGWRQLSPFFALSCVIFATLAPTLILASTSWKWETISIKQRGWQKKERFASIKPLFFSSVTVPVRTRNSGTWFEWERDWKSLEKRKKKMLVKIGFHFLN